MKKLYVTALAAALVLAGAPAMAKGPGKYTVKGTNSADKSTYTGTATITKTGEDSYRIVSVIGDDKFDGYAIGDDDLLAVTFSGGGNSSVALYVAQPDGSYNAVWAFKGDKKVSTETLTPR